MLTSTPCTWRHFEIEQALSTLNEKQDQFAEFKRLSKEAEAGEVGSSSSDSDRDEASSRDGNTDDEDDEGLVNGREERQRHDGNEEVFLDPSCSANPLL